MNNKIEIFKVWAPEDTSWTEWVKPVLFNCYPRNINESFIIPELASLPEAKTDTMYIIDLPGKYSVAEGLAFASLGYRPIPLYNGVDGPDPDVMVVNTSDLLWALHEGTRILKEMNIKRDAPPAFLLDSNRMTGTGKQVNTYDNRWCIFPQDMPSAVYLESKGIKNVIIRSDRIQEDLSHILCRYQEKGIQIYLHLKNAEAAPVTVAKPSRYKSLFYRFMVILKLTRNPVGGFGCLIPEPVQHDSSDRHYYGFG